MVSPMRRAKADHTAIDDSGPEPAERLSYPVADAAALVGISERRMWDLIRLRLIRSFREGTRRLISRRALEEYIAEREAKEEKVA